MTNLTFLWLTLVLCFINVSIGRAEDKPYNVELNSFDKNSDFENDGKWVDWGTLRMKKVGRNKFTLAGDFEFKLNMGDEQRISLQVFVYDSNNKQKGMLVMNVNKPFCQFVNEDTDTYPYLKEASNLPDQGGCPFPKGEYTINNYELETNFLPDDAPKGDYLIELTTMDKDTGVAGLIAIVTLT
ncbi:uncharacterized protein Dwil_GK16147 [Drosophila willistoni]|uniref:MD-2-related lipid-recognition domain-containing protein n=1 Tax=Drosophila willistoni TaxID=7260 RepID=B4N2C0_DROWI|nr:uncharacterized protein LOC6644859 [Drosophila willistoni]EDW78509.1 uncharacterized protein Dwil_GK16147 [Drosophila willistoni]